jgi:hypothetical protein
MALGAHPNPPKLWLWAGKAHRHFAPSQLYFTLQVDVLITSLNHPRNIQKLVI